MRKKRLIIYLFVLVISVFAFSKVKVIAINDLELVEDAKSAVLMEASSNEVIYEKDAFTQRSPASMTKIMTMILIMEAIDKELLTYDQELTTSINATKLGGTQIYLEVGEKMTVKDLLKAIAVASANDATVVFAEAIGGTYENFIQMMNDKGKEIGLTNTCFKNSHGLSAVGHYSCAMDMAIMSSYLINNYPKILEFTSIYEDYVRENTEKKFWLVNRNKLVKFVDGVDGLKTGWTNEAGYCIVATMKKNDLRFISVVMNCSAPNYRLSESVNMLNYGFNNYEITSIYKKNDIISSYENASVSPNKYNIVVSKDINILTKKGEKQKNVTIEKDIDYYKVLEDNVVGKIRLFIDGKLIKETDLIVLEDIKKASFFEILGHVFKEIFLVSK